jgi:hypothetical protein
MKPYADGSKPFDYGLIAEEVEDVYPDLVVERGRWPSGDCAVPEARSDAAERAAKTAPTDTGAG